MGRFQIYPSGNDSLTGRKILGTVLAAGGVLILINPFKSEFSSGTIRGDLLILLNSLSYAFYVAVSKRMIIKYGALKSIAWLFIFGSIINVPLGFYFLRQLDSSRDYLFFAGFAMIGIVLNQLFYFTGLSLEVGKRADLVAVDEEKKVTFSMIGGKIVG